MDALAVAKAQFGIKVLELVDTFLEHFSLDFFVQDATIQLFQVLNEIFNLFKNLYVIAANSQLLDSAVHEYLNHYLVMIDTMLEDDAFSGQIVQNAELLKAIDELASKDNSMLASNANLSKLR